MAISGKSPIELLNEIHENSGAHTFRKIDIEFTAEQRERIAPTAGGDSTMHLGGVEVASENRSYGVPLNLVGTGWTIVPILGSEPHVRIFHDLGFEQPLNHLDGYRRTYPASTGRIGLPFRRDDLCF